jgi:hypothetical protein
MSRTGKLALLAALLAPWLFVWHGVDFTDQGLSLAHYRLFSDHPDAIGPFQHMWLTNAVGAAGERWLGALGVLGARLLWAACLSLCALLAFVTARETMRADLAAFGALFAAALLAHRRETWFHYNTLTSVTYMVCATCLICGIVRRRDGLVFAAGVAAGMSPFARLPNAWIVVLASAPAFAAFIDRERRARVGRDSALFAAGFAAAAAGVVAAMHALGHVPGFARSVRALLGGHGGDAFTHDRGVLALRFARDQAAALAFGLAALVGVLAALQLSARVPRAAFVAIAAAALIAVAALLTNQAYWHWFAAGCAYVVLGALCAGRTLPGTSAGDERQPAVELRIAAWVALLALVLAPFGSANGIRNSYVGGWLAITFVLGHLLATEGGRQPHARALAWALLGALGLESAHHAVFYTYRDGPKIALVHGVDEPKLVAQFTSAARARVVEEALAALRVRVAPGDLLLAHEGTSLFHYLLDTRPFGDRTWPMLEAPVRLSGAFEEARRRHGCLPVAVRALASTSTSTWPSDAKLGPRMRELDQRNRQVIARFLRRERYSVSWRNDFFEVSEPPARSPRSACR